MELLQAQRLLMRSQTTLNWMVTQLKWQHNQHWGEDNYSDELNEAIKLQKDIELWLK